MTITGYTTINDEWGILIDKDLAKHDLLLRIYTTKGECGNIVEHLRDGSARQRGNVGKDK